MNEGNLHVRRPWILTSIAMALLVMLSFAAFGQTNVAPVTTQSATITTLTSKNLIGVLNATQFAGADIGAKVNRAFNACANCEVVIPQGSYRYSTPIVIPVYSGGTGALVGQGSGTTMLTYMGAANTDAIAARSTIGNSNVRLRIADFSVSCGTGCAAHINGLHLEGFNGGVIENIAISGFTGDCLFNQGNNAAEFFSNSFNSCLNGIHNKGVNIGGFNYSANALHFIGGEIAVNTQYGVYEDGTGVGGPNEQNVYMDIDFEVNGTTASTNAQIFLQSTDSDLIMSNYIEGDSSSKGAASIVLGDSTYKAKGTNVIGNFIGTNGGTETINDFNTLGSYYAANSEDAVVSYFLSHGSASRGTVLGGGNLAEAATIGFITGSDGGDDTIGFYPSISFPNAIGASPQGPQFNAISSPTSQVRILAHSGASHIADFDDYLYNNLAYIDISGDYVGLGSMKYGGGIAIASSNAPLRYVGTLTATASDSDSLAVSNLPVGAHCFAQAQDSTSASLTGVFVPPIATAGTVVLDHSSTGGGSFSISCAFE